MSAKTSLLMKSCLSVADGVNGMPKEYFLTIVHIRSSDAASTAEALQTYMESNHLDPQITLILKSP